MRHAAIYGTSLVLVHLLVNIVHGFAHLKLHIELSPPAMLFVIGVIIVCPLVAASLLLWTSQQRLGLILLALSMAASLHFGIYHHLVAMSPDFVGLQASSLWAVAFAITAYLLLLIEATGIYISVQPLYERSI